MADKPWNAEHTRVRREWRTAEGHRPGRVAERAAAREVQTTWRAWRSPTGKHGRRWSRRFERAMWRRLLPGNVHRYHPDWLVPDPVDGPAQEP